MIFRGGELGTPRRLSGKQIRSSVKSSARYLSADFSVRTPRRSVCIPVQPAGYTTGMIKLLLYIASVGRFLLFLFYNFNRRLALGPGCCCCCRPTGWIIYSRNSPARGRFFIFFTSYYITCIQHIPVFSMSARRGNCCSSEARVYQKLHAAMFLFFFLRRCGSAACAQQQ